MQVEGSLLRSQEPDTGPYREPAESNPQLVSLRTIFLPSMSCFINQSVLLTFLIKTVCAFVMRLCMLYIPPITPPLALLCGRIHFRAVKGHLCATNLWVLWFLLREPHAVERSLLLDSKHHTMHTYGKVEV
jgi:hypothetical protein